MRFDDSLQTVLAADSSTPVGATLAWRQLVDLIGRDRAPADGTTLARLRELRPTVPRDARAASGRALAFAAPPAGLVGLFAEDEPAIAAPVLRTATLSGAEWTALLPQLTPGGRSILRHRRDLPAEAGQALQAFGPVDFVLPQPNDDRVTSHGRVAPPASAPEPVLEVAPKPMQVPAPEEDFVPVGTVARAIPGLAELLATPPVETPVEAPPPTTISGERFEISDLVARIDAFQRQDRVPAARSQAELFDLAPALSRRFRFESDADGLIRWVEGAERGALIGLPLALAARPAESGVDGAVAGAFRRRAAFADARLIVGGRSSAAGDWRISATPAFDAASGRFIGYRGIARRPRRDETAAPAAQGANRGAESMRQLVHELRTPLNAIAGFAEMIEAELLGPVPTDYRRYATDIRGQADRLLSGIDDLDTAARAESGTLELRPEPVPMVPLLRRIAGDLRPLADLRGAGIAIIGAEDLAVLADMRVTERLAGRLLATLVGAAGRDETITIAVTDGDGQVVIRHDRPRALGAAYPVGVALDSEQEDAPGAPLLGAEFALRLAANLAREQGGALTIGDDALTLRLPAAETPIMEQASIR